MVGIEWKYIRYIFIKRGMRMEIKYSFSFLISAYQISLEGLSIDVNQWSLKIFYHILLYIKKFNHKLLHH